MDSVKNNEEIEYTKENAKRQLKQGNYSLAKTIYEYLWENSNKSDVYLLFAYGNALRKDGKGIKFIEICRIYNSDPKIINNNYIKSVLCWCLYDCYIKDYQAEDEDNYNDFLKRAEYIVENSEQKNAKEHFLTPYVFTVLKVIKVLKKRASVNYREIAKWLAYIEPEILSEEVFAFQDEKGKERELASPKEFYYQNKVKALEKLGEYVECIEACEMAFHQISKFHYRNNVWIKARLYFSKCMVAEDVETAIVRYKELAYKEDMWFMYHKLSQICLRYNKLQDALLYICKAYSGRFEYEKMVNLLFDTAFLWQALGNENNAKLFFHACAYYRNCQGWSISEEMQFAIINYNIDIEKIPSIKELQYTANKYVLSIEGVANHYEGTINNILANGYSGFIKPNNGEENIFFNLKDVIDKKPLVRGNTVSYETIQCNDGRIKAIKIKERR